MKLQDAKREAMLKQWREMVYQCRNSGETVAAWCQAQNIPTATYYRRQKLVWEHESGKLPEKIVRGQALQAVENKLPAVIEPVPYFPTSAADEDIPRITLEKGEWKLEIRNGADVTLLHQILEVLG